MIEEHLQKTESTVQNAENIPAEKKTELLGLLAKLKAVLDKVSQTHQQNAQSIAYFAEASAREATRAKRRPPMLKTALDRLKQSVEQYEASHPELVLTVNQLAALLAEMGL
jgi:ABC-type transporter Mla subunit MlaD